MDAATKTAGRRQEPPPCDAFGGLFRRLRVRRGYTAHGLSAAMSRSKPYFRLWECRADRAVNRSFLLQVCDFLQVRESERRRLLKLADQRLMALETSS